MSSSVVRPSPHDTLMHRVLERTGLRFPAGRPLDLALATQRMIREAGVDSVEEYLARIDSGQISVSSLAKELRIGETYFFREPEQFAFIREVVLPDIAGRRGSPSPIRIWSTGCATGEEPYSLAIVLEELGLGDRGHILGTDVSRDAVLAARAAEYTRWSMRGPEAERVRRFFHAAGDKLRLTDTIRRRVKFNVQNLARDVFPALIPGLYDFDLILCRNVLIYFDEETNADVARRLYASLAEGGWLITASSDPPLSALAPFQTVVTERGVFYRKLTDAPKTTLIAPIAPPPHSERSAPGSSPARKSVAPPRNPAIPSASSAVEQVAGERPRRPSLSEAAARISAMANAGDLVAGEEAAKTLARQQPLNAEIHYVHGLILTELRRDQEAISALRRALYLDPGFIMAHLTLAMAHRRVGDLDGRARSLRTVRRLCAALPQTDLVPLGGGACAAHVDAMAAEQENLSPSAPGSKHG